jgi:hypothetical protein
VVRVGRLVMGNHQRGRPTFGGARRSQIKSLSSRHMHVWDANALHPERRFWRNERVFCRPLGLWFPCFASATLGRNPPAFVRFNQLRAIVTKCFFPKMRTFTINWSLCVVVRWVVWTELYIIFIVFSSYFHNVQFLFEKPQLILLF